MSKGNSNQRKEKPSGFYKMGIEYKFEGIRNWAFIIKRHQNSFNQYNDKACSYSAGYLSMQIIKR